MRIAETISKILVDNGVIQQSEKEVYRYGIELLVLKGSALILAIIISLELKTSNILFVFLLFFAPIRRYSGGIHAGSAAVCMLISEALLVLCYWIIENIQFSFWGESMALVGSVAVIVLLSPDVSEKKPINSTQKHKYKRYVVIICGITLIMFLLMILSKNTMISQTITVVYLLQACLLISSRCAPYLKRISFKYPHQNTE